MYSNTNIVTIILISILIICLLYGCRNPIENLENRCDQYSDQDSCKKSSNCVWNPKDSKCVLPEFSQCPYKTKKSCNHDQNCQWVNSECGEKKM